MMQLASLVSAVVAPVVSLKPSDFLTVEYTPALLQPVYLDGSVTQHHEYGQACQAGFEEYFIEMYKGDEDVFVDRYYSRSEVVKYVIATLADTAGCFAELQGWFEKVSVAWHAGYLHGWLSALALTSPGLARVGLQVLVNMVKFELEKEYQHAA
jgi:hypothetical protein